MIVRRDAKVSLARSLGSSGHLKIAGQIRSISDCHERCLKWMDDRSQGTGLPPTKTHLSHEMTATGGMASFPLLLDLSLIHI